MKIEKRYVDEKEVAETIGCSIQTLRNDRHLGRGLPYVKKGKRTVRYFLPDVFKYMESRKIIHEEN